MVKQTGQHGYLFKFDKVNATAPLIFSHLIIISSGAVLVDITNQLIMLQEKLSSGFSSILYHGCQKRLDFTLARVNATLEFARVNATQRLHLSCQMSSGKKYSAKFSSGTASGSCCCVQTYGTKILKAVRQRKGYEDG